MRDLGLKFRIIGGAIEETVTAARDMMSAQPWVWKRRLQEAVVSDDVRLLKSAIFTRMSEDRDTATSQMLARQGEAARILIEAGLGAEDVRAALRASDQVILQRDPFIVPQAFAMDAMQQLSIEEMAPQGTRAIRDAYIEDGMSFWETINHSAVVTTKDVTDSTLQRALFLRQELRGLGDLPDQTFNAIALAPMLAGLRCLGDKLSHEGWEITDTLLRAGNMAEIAIVEMMNEGLLDHRAAACSLKPVSSRRFMPDFGASPAPV